MQADELAPGDVLGGYEVGEALGAGGRAMVYRGRSLETGEAVAIKRVSGTDPARIEIESL